MIETRKYNNIILDHVIEIEDKTASNPNLKLQIVDIGVDILIVSGKEKKIREIAEQKRTTRM